MKLGKFLFGMGVGAIAGLLLAPKKGSELREDLMNESMKVLDKAKNLTKEDVEAILGETIESVRKSVDEFDVDEFKEVATSKLAELEAKLEEFSNKIQETNQYNQLKEGVLDITDKVNTKIDQVKTKVKDSQFFEEDLEDLEKEIDNVEDKLDELIEEIKD